MLEGASESLKKSKLKKKKSSGKDWTWKDQVDMVKWTDRMINVSYQHFLILNLLNKQEQRPVIKTESSGTGKQDISMLVCLTCKNCFNIHVSG
jgi:hypothetical protein